MNLRLAAVVAGTLAVGCGLRSDPVSMSGTGLRIDTDTSAPDEGEPGTCTNPFVLEGLADSSISGMLMGGGNYTGWCGGDGGREDVYLFSPTQNIDVTLRFEPASTSGVSVRVVESEEACLSGDETATVLCDRSVIDDGMADPRHFFARAGSQYYIIVDSPAVSETSEDDVVEYSGVVTLDPPPISQCAPHPDTIFQLSGSTFTWFNEFSPGQGRVDGPCGGPGKEDMFRLEATYPGNVAISVFGSGGFEPVVGIRQGCGGTTEFTCNSAELSGTPGSVSLSYFINVPGEYWINIDDATVDGGAYSLEVFFE